MHKVLLAKLKESLFSVLPITLIVFVVSCTPLADFSARELTAFGICAVFLIIGIALFGLGADLAMTPMGEHVGSGLTKSKKMLVLLSVCFVMGVLITVAEPDLAVLAEQVKTAIPQSMLLIATVGIGVGIFLVIAVLKIAFRKNLSSLLMFFYMMLFAFCAVMLDRHCDAFLPLSFDAGGVTTGPITVPFIMALGVGIATTIGGKHAGENSFGLIALCSVGPMIAVILFSLTAKGNPTYSLPADYTVSTNMASKVGWTILGSLKEVAIALSLIVVFFAILQGAVLKLPRKKIGQIAIGILFTLVGLVVFLTAVKVGFMPIGFKLGQSIAGQNKALLVVFAFILGMVVVLAEPAIHVLNRQVEQITGGGVTRKQMLIALSVGVGISIGLSVIRILCGFSLLYYLIPGYLLSLGLSFFVPKLYTAIAFDSGGVASGPLTSGFILPLAVGACSAVAPDGIMQLAFGIVAMVAMTPLITIQTLGFKAVMSAKVRQKITMKRILAADDEQIIYFE